MDVELEPGTYVIAVSGGVDSVVLLDMLAELAKNNTQKAKNSQNPPNSLFLNPRFRFIVAHYDHGIRADSHLDKELVRKLAWRHGFPFVYDNGNLGASVSEAKARECRYRFLRRVKAAAEARAVITAHHQDDLLETAAINISRGTSHKGLAALSNKPWLLRPLLDTPKSKIIAYAKKHKLAWREDSTNTDERYLRNYIRHRILKNLSPKQRKTLLSYVTSARQASQGISRALEDLFGSELARPHLDRKLIIGMEHKLALEFLAEWLRCHGIRDFDKKTLERLTVAVKTAKPNTEVDVNKAYKLALTRQKVSLNTRKR